MIDTSDWIVPRLGDVLVTTKPLNCDSLTHRAGEYLRVRLSTPRAVELARTLVALGTWRVEQRKEST